MDILEQAQFDSSLRRQSPFAQYQLFDVVFQANPMVDTEIVHGLEAPTPDHIGWIVIRQSQPGSIYRATDVEWGDGFIKLRSSIPSMVATLLIFVTKTSTQYSAAPLDSPAGDPWLACGATSFTEGAGFWLAYNAGTPQLRLGDPAGQYISWDGSSLTIAGTVTITNGTSANLLANSEFRQGLTEGAGNSSTWTLVATGPNAGTWSSGYGAASNYPTNGGAAYFSNSATTGTSDAAYLEGPTIPVIGGSYYEWSAYVRSLRCTVQMEVVWLDAAAAETIVTGDPSTELDGSTDATLLENWNRIYYIGQAPADAVAATLRVRYVTPV